MQGTSFTEELYQEYKPLLFSLAYRMLGSVTDAEDVVHETFLSLPAPASEAQPIRNMKAFLCKIATHRCIDRLRSASKQREVYVGPWLPEPLVIGPAGENDPYRLLEQAESLSTAYLLLLQQLSWVERVVFLLREALQYNYDEIGEIVGKSGTNCRQIFHRAKRSIGLRPSQDSEAVNEPSPLQAPESSEQFAGLINQFVSALASGDLGKLLSVLSEDATLLSDGGGKVMAAIRPIFGADRISRFFEGLLKKAQPGFSFRIATVNGTPGIVTYVNGQPDSVLSFRMDNGRIASIYIVVNPDKLVNVR